MDKVPAIDSPGADGTAICGEDGAPVRECGQFPAARVPGQVPASSSMRFIASDLVDAARRREVHGVTLDPVIFGLDCARFGDDRSTLAIRCGRDARSRPWKRWRQTDAMALAGDVALQAQAFHPDAIFVDAGSIGAAVVDRLRQLGVENVHEVWFGGGGRDAAWAGSAGGPGAGGELRVKTANKRSEMWTNLRGWLAGGAIPDEDGLAADLTGVEYGYAADQVSILLEKKAHMKARGLASPDDGDALALTFAEPVMPRDPAWLDPGRYRRQRPETEEEIHRRIYGGV